MQGPHFTVLTFNSCTKCLGKPGMIHDRTPDCHGRHGRMDGRKTERNYDSQVRWVTDMLGLLLDMLSMGICKTRHWQTSGQLVQELNV